jgi:hypothetical protein
MAALHLTLEGNPHGKGSPVNCSFECAAGNFNDQAILRILHQKRGKKRQYHFNEETILRQTEPVTCSTRRTWFLHRGEGEYSR